MLLSSSSGRVDSDIGLSSRDLSMISADFAFRTGSSILSHERGKFDVWVFANL